MPARKIEEIRSCTPSVILVCISDLICVFLHFLYLMTGRGGGTSTETDRWKRSSLQCSRFLLHYPCLYSILEDFLHQFQFHFVNLSHSDNSQTLSIQSSRAGYFQGRMYISRYGVIFQHYFRRPEEEVIRRNIPTLFSLLRRSVMAMFRDSCL